MGTSWTDERVESLKHLWADGWSCSQIAERLGDVTRNAVIGKVTRLGLPARAARQVRGTILRPRPPSNRPRRQTAHSQALPPLTQAQQIAWATVNASSDLDIPASERKTLQELEMSDCRWPYGDPRIAGEFYFCGKRKVPGLSYCEFHARRGVQSPNMQRRHGEDRGGKHAPMDQTKALDEVGA